MRFASRQIKGRGRARTLGFPTINLEIPKDIDLEYGIYGAFLYIDDEKYLGALHYGPSPTFNDEYKSCEIYLIDLKDKDVPHTENTRLEFELVRRMRGVIKFDKVDDLVRQIDEDVREIRLLADSQNR
ncbi:MAG: riboflavin kinase [Patescibacteria group bacterium]